MADLSKFFSKIKLVKVRGRKMTVIALVVAMLLATGALAALHLSMNVLKNKTEDLRQQAALLEGENSALAEDIEQVGSIQAIVEIAEKELGLVPPDAVFYETAPQQ